MPSKAVPPRDSVQSAVSKLPETSTPREKIEQIVDVKNTTKLLKNKDQWAEITTLILSELSAKEKLEKKCADLVAKHTEDVKKAKAKAAAELKQKMSTAQAEHQAAIAALEETLQESKEQLEFLTQELAKAEVSATQAGKIAEMAAEEKEAARTRCTELETRTSELETANFNLLAHSEKQQKELSSLMDAAHTAKESAMEYKTANIRISHALEDATKKIAEMADLGNRLQTQHVVPRTPQVETNGQEGLGAPTSASSSSSSRPGSRGGKVKLTPLSNAREASEAPNVSPITGYQKWASYYGIEGESGGGVKRKDGDFAFLPGHQMSLKQQFNSAVCERFGCLIRGWRTLASYSEAGADSGLNLSEFTNACHELQLISAANTKMTFHEFARSFNGKLTLPDLDPEAYRVWSGLRLRLSDLFGSPQGGIREMFGPKDWLSTEDFLDCLDQIKLPKGKRLATYLAMDGRVFADCLVLSEKEIPLLKVTRESLLEAQRRGESLSPDAKRFLAREEQRAKGLIPPIMGTTAAAQTKAASSAGPQPSYSPSAGMRRYQSYTTHGAGDDQQVRGSLNGSLFSQNGTGGPSSKSTGLELFENLKKLLVNKYRTLSLAWKTAFDLQGRGHCGSQEFAKVCRSLGFEGANTVWREVVGSGNDRAKVGGLLTYADLDPTGAKLIAEFKERMLERYRDFVTAWVVALDLDGSNRVPLEEWTTILCHQSTFGDYSEADARTLFRLLKSVDRKYLELRDIDVKAGQQLMDGTVPPHLERIKAETRKQVLGRSVSRERTSAFLGRQNSHEIQNLRAEIAQNQRLELNAKVERRQSRDMGAASKDEFLGFLKRKFGNVPRAWRVAFDKDGSGKVSQQEFFSTCRELKAFIGDIGKLFSELDVDGGGILSLAEMDPTAWKILEEFEEKCSVVLQQAVGGEDHGEPSSAPSSAADDNKNEKSGPPRTRSNSLTARRNRSWWNVFFADQNIEERHTRIRMLQNASVTATICKIDFPKFQEFCQHKLNMHNEGSAKRIFKYFAADESSTFLTESDFKALDIPKMKETKLAKKRAGSASVGGAAMLSRSRSSSLRGNADRDKSKMSSTSSSRWFNTGSGSASDSNLDHSSGREQGAFSTSDAENSKSEAVDVDEQVEEYGSFEPTTISRVLEESEQQVMDAVSEVKQEQDAENIDAAVAVCLPPEFQEVATKEKLDFSAAEEEHTRSGSAGSGSASASGEEIVTAASAEAEAAEQAGVPATAEHGVTEAGAAAPAPAPAGETSSTEAEVAAVSSTTRTIATALGGDVITDVDLFCSTLVDSAEGDCGKAWSMLFKDAESLAEEAKFVDFGKAVRALKFQGNLKLLWTKVGGNEDNTLGPGDMEEALFF
mmetsp:Transcript_9615/g.23616  ORF Transcript_9615/g.23616 Transcript_9615/m.23616 type:complete len:1367 (+) Transcript_9615:133-4233(+)